MNQATMNEYYIDPLVIEIDDPPFEIDSGIMTAQHYNALENGRDEYGGTVTVVGLAS